MKKLLLCTIVFSNLLGSFVYASDARIGDDKNSFALESPMIPVVDGKSYGVHGKVFGLILQNRREIRKRLYGIPTKSGGRSGMFEFGDNACCLVELAQVESENEAEYLSQLNYIEQNRINYTEDEWLQERAKIEQKYQSTKAVLQKVLEEAKEDFIEFTKGYVNGINGIKEPLLVLVEEFCEKKGIEHCLLLQWGGTQAGDEPEMIRQEILTVRDFAEFCIDLSDFLEVLARSCPKGKKLFIDMVKKAKQAK